jgi:hypothetical protein
MTLHRSREYLVLTLAMLLGGPLLLWASQNGWELRLLFIPVGSTALFVFGVLAMVAAAITLVGQLLPFEFAMDEAGLRLRRVAGINRSLPWASVDTVILEPPATAKGKPQLVLVPADGADLGVRADYTNKLDGRPSVVLLSLDALRESREQVVSALSTYAGPRFHDMVGESVKEFLARKKSEAS